jgi:hypothetical protein
VSPEGASTFVEVDVEDVAALMPPSVRRRQNATPVHLIVLVW